MEADIVMTIAMATAVVLLVNQIGRILRARMYHRTVREAILADSAAAGDLLDRIDDEKSRGVGEDRVAIVLLALGAALIGCGLIQGGASTVRELASIAIFPIFVGAALLGRIWYLGRRGAVS